ncbi:MAG: plasmid mobilization relaxosome protein MobC [Bacteroidota bacterium]
MSAITTKKTGTRPRSEKRKRNSFLIARCTSEEKKLVEERANSKGLSLGDFIRSQSIGQKPLKIVPKKGPATTAILLLKAELNKIGSNVNQIAKVCNTNGTVAPAQVDAMLFALGKCYDEIIKFSKEA